MPLSSSPIADIAAFDIQTNSALHPAVDLEWLLTNGLGGFASSTVAGCNTRRYHGLLCAALTPPVGRLMALNRIGELLFLDRSDDRLHELSVNQFRQTFHPRGDQYLKRFELSETARWHFEVDGVHIVKELQTVWRRNIIGLRYTLHSDRPRKVELQLLPFVSLRDFHALRTASSARFRVSGAGQQASITSPVMGSNNPHSPAEHVLYLQTDGGHFIDRSDWWYGHTYAVETERGQDDTEDLFTPGPFAFSLQLEKDKPQTVTLWAGMEPPGLRDWDEELKRRPRPQKPAAAPRAADSPILPRLLRAAADFIVLRKQTDGSPAATVIAGYPWFADWGRDTMISLPGLLLSTGRFGEAAQVLGVFAQYVSDGMIPNRFDDYTNEPHYNTVDASLWFIHASFEFARLSGDAATFEKKLRPACEAILAGYERGTRFSIRMDPADSLITAGDPQTQLTWMDAKCNGIAFTPRHGKAVEINALWYHALKLMGREKQAATVAAGFIKAFWLNDFRGLADVIHDGVKDTSLRPNQIFAVSLPNSPLSGDQQAAVVEVVRRELLTPHGLRTLNKSDAHYKGRFEGDQMRRDAAYHNGTVWPWLIGPFLQAYLRVNNRSPKALAQARDWLRPLLDHFERQACIGQISEVFDGDEPQRPAGCFAQAWSVAEVLRMAMELGL